MNQNEANDNCNEAQFKEEPVDQQCLNKESDKVIQEDGGILNDKASVTERKRETVGEAEGEIKEEEEVRANVNQHRFFSSADNVVDEINKIQYSLYNNKPQPKGIRQELLRKGKDQDAERNKVINDYISVLDNKKKIRIACEEEDEDDEFSKAEATYKQTNKQDANNLSTFNLNQQQQQQHLKSKLFYTSKEVLAKNQSLSNFSITLKHPETLYIKENRYQRRQQTLRKISKVNEHSPSLNGENDRSLSSSSKSPFASKKAQMFKLFQKERLALQCLNDSKNPYSKLWIDRILMLRYKSKIQVKGFVNAIPQLRLQKIKDVPFPNIESNGCQSSSVGQRYDGCEESKGELNRTKRIEYPFILKYFEEKNKARKSG